MRHLNLAKIELLWFSRRSLCCWWRRRTRTGSSAWTPARPSTLVQNTWVWPGDIFRWANFRKNCLYRDTEHSYNKWHSQRGPVWYPGCIGQCHQISLGGGRRLVKVTFFQNFWAIYFLPFFLELNFLFSNRISNFFIIIIFRAVAAFSKAGLGHKHVAARSSSGRLIGNIVSPWILSVQESIPPNFFFENEDFFSIFRC